MRKIFVALLLVLTMTGLARADGMGGGGLSLPYTCSNGQVVVYNSTTGLWDTCAANAAAGTGNVATSGTPSNHQWAGWTDSTHIKGFAMTASKPICTDSNKDPVTCSGSEGVWLTPTGDGSGLTGLTASQLPNAAANGSTKGVATFNANDFDASSGVISIDYTNGQAAATGVKGFLTGTDWDTFNGKANANQTMYIGTTSVAINRASNALTLAGITLTTPNIGVATATSVNKMAITAPTTSSTLAVADGKTFTVSNTLTLAGTDSKTITFPNGSGTVAFAGTMGSAGKLCVVNADGITIDCNTDTPTGLGTITAVGNVTSGAAFTTGVPGTTLYFNNATAGKITLTAQTGDLGTSAVSLPAASGTLIVGPANVPITIAGPNAARTYTLPNNDFTMTIPAGKTLALGGGMTTSGAYDFQFTVPGAYTYTLPGASKTLAASDASNLALGSDARGDMMRMGATAYERFAKGTQYSVLTMGANDPAWSAYFLQGTAAATYTLPGSTKTLAASDASNLALGSDARGDILRRGASAYERVAKGTQYSILSMGANDPDWTSYFLQGTAAQTYTFPTTSKTVAASDASNLALGSDARGDMLRRGASAYERFAKGSSGSILMMGANDPGWTTATWPTAGTSGKLIRGDGTNYAETTLTMPTTIAAGSVFAANTANTLSAITSSSGTYFLKNVDGTVSWATGVGTIGGATGSTDNAILRADGTGGVTIQSSGVTISDTGDINIPTGGSIQINGSSVLAGGSDGSYGLTLLSNTSVTPGSVYQLYVNSGVWKMNTNGTESTIPKSTKDYTLAFTTTGNTALNLPTSGTLAVLGTNTFSGSQTLRAGTSTAATAPLYFQSGTNLTTASAGAMEFDGTNLYFTPSTTRYAAVLSPAAGAIKFAGSSSPRTITVNDNDFSVLVPSGKSINLAGGLATSGAYDATFTLANTTTVAFPTSGTLAILGANTFTAGQTVNYANSNTSADLATIGGAAITLNGSKVYRGLVFTPGAVTASSTGNTITGVAIGNLGTHTNSTGYGLSIGTGYDYSIELGSGGTIDFNAGDVTLTHSSNALTLSGGDLALGANNLTMTGSLAATGSRVTKGWFTDVESTNMPTVGGSALNTVLGAAQGTSLAVTGTLDGKATLLAGTTVDASTYLSSYVVCTGNCTITPPAPAAGTQICARTSNNGSYTISFNALGATKYYEKPDHTGLGTATTGTLAATAAVTNSICLVGYDSTHYYVWGTPVGTWTAN